MNLIGFFDSWVVNLIEPIRGDFLTIFLKLVTYLGEWPIVLIAAIIISFFLKIKNKNKQAFILFLTTLGGLADSFILKNLIHRPRPADGLISESSYSFPSAHALISVVFYGFIIYLLWKKVKNIKLRILIISIGLAVVLLLGFSRIYLNVHYFSDVIGGYLVGFFWLAAGIYVSEKLFKQNNT